MELDMNWFYTKKNLQIELMIGTFVLKLIINSLTQI